jgi:thiosulfate/3-mercaptopyruvate sulfurtransferase
MQLTIAARIAVLALLASVRASSAPPQNSESLDPWTAQALFQPPDLAVRLNAPKETKPAIFYVGFPVLYRGAHIRDAVLAGPGSKADGLDLLTHAVGKLPRNREIVLYCGCCPFQKCPNIRPAYKAVAALGFSRVKVLVIETNLHTDWVMKGYPVAREP